MAGTAHRGFIVLALCPIALAWWLWCPTALRVKDKILGIDPPHELCAILNSLFELLVRVAARELLLRASDERCS